MKKLLVFLGLAMLLVCGVAVSQVSVIGELSNDKEARPGEKYEGAVSVRNDTNEPQEVKV
jgi:hypothetical protein